jgi:hypothetical protein
VVYSEETKLVEPEIEEEILKTQEDVKMPPSTTQDGNLTQRNI